MEKVIKWKLMRSTESYYTRYFMYFELDLNMAIIHKLIRYKYVYTYSALFSRRFELCKHIPIRRLEENYIRGYCYTNKKVQLLASFVHNKYPTHQSVMNYLHVSKAVEKFDKEFLDNSITYLEGNLSFGEIKTPIEINNITNLILYLWKKNV